MRMNPSSEAVREFKERMSGGGQGEPIDKSYQRSFEMIGRKLVSVIMRREEQGTELPSSNWSRALEICRSS